MNESGVWGSLKRAMAGRWQAQRIESSTGIGIPDVSFAMASVKGFHGWIEIKYLKEWPKRDSTLVKIPLRPEQRLWIESRGKVAGNIWVFIRISDDFFLIPWNIALRLNDHGDTREMWYNLKGYIGDKLDAEILQGGLQNGC